MPKNQLFKIFYTFACKMFFPVDKNFRGKIADKHVENLKQASGQIAQLRPQNLSVESFAG